MLGCAARPGNLGVHRAVRGGSGSSETLERCRIPSVNSGRLTASKTTLGYFRESGAQGEGPRVRIRLPPPGSHEQIEPSGELTTGRKQTYSDGRGTDGSNPIPSSRESANPRSRSVVALSPKWHLHRLHLYLPSPARRRRSTAPPLATAYRRQKESLNARCSRRLRTSNAASEQHHPDPDDHH